MTRSASESPDDLPVAVLQTISGPSVPAGELQEPELDGELPADVLHVGLLSFEMDCGTLRIVRHWHGERLDCGSFYMLPEEFGAFAAWLAAHVEAGERRLPARPQGPLSTPSHPDPTTCSKGPER